MPHILQRISISHLKGIPSGLSRTLKNNNHICRDYESRIIEVNSNGGGLHKHEELHLQRTNNVCMALQRAQHDLFP